MHCKWSTIIAVFIMQHCNLLYFYKYLNVDFVMCMYYNVCEYVTLHAHNKVYIILFSRWCVQRELQLCDGQWSSSLHTSTANWIWRCNILHEVPSHLPLLVWLEANAIPYISAANWMSLLYPIIGLEDWMSTTTIYGSQTTIQSMYCIVHLNLSAMYNCTCRVYIH